ncbi:hypothetical protein BDP27DRAFT_237624 [Rhodocollybia butyracea]|uniref:Uncharacterized protein n=1 Tax=Rhodocollybia butyracea TaxID=206335 RepID=A0A9P5U2F3_9AGAR|nr:hypothetical protein BDP27DRAFT_237624 [Rhodocollybia butyracea]
MNATAPSCTILPTSMDTLSASQKNCSSAGSSSSQIPKDSINPDSEGNVDDSASSKIKFSQWRKQRASSRQSCVSCKILILQPQALFFVYMRIPDGYDGSIETLTVRTLTFQLMPYNEISSLVTSTPRPVSTLFVYSEFRRLPETVEAPAVFAFFGTEAWSYRKLSSSLFLTSLIVLNSTLAKM